MGTTSRRRDVFAMAEQPKYLQVADTLRREIAEGIFRDGQTLMTEEELRMRFDVSRQTIRQAISLLEDDGLVDRRRGSGTYVRHGPRRRQGIIHVGVITTFITDYIFPSITQGMETVLNENGAVLSLNAMYNDVKTERNILERSDTAVLPTMNGELSMEEIIGSVNEHTSLSLSTPRTATRPGTEIPSARHTASTCHARTSWQQKIAVPGGRDLTHEASAPASEPSLTASLRITVAPNSSTAPLGAWKTLHEKPFSASIPANASRRTSEKPIPSYPQYAKLT